MVSRKDAGRRLDARDGRPSVAERMQTSDGANTSQSASSEQAESRELKLHLEREVLGACLRFPEQASEILGSLSGGDLETSHHVWILEAIRNIDRDGGAVDAARICSELEKFGRLGEVGLNQVVGLLEASAVSPDMAIQSREDVLERSNNARLRSELAAISAGQHGTTTEELIPAVRQIAEATQISRTPISDAASAWNSQPLCRPEPTRWSLRFPDRDGVQVEDGQGDGFMRPGKVAILSAEGGVGKTTAMVQLAASNALGIPWMGYFEPDATIEGSKTLLVLGENDLQESADLLWRVSEDLGLTDAERDEAHKRTIILSMAGHDIGFLRRDSFGALQPTSIPDEILRLAKREGCRTIILDGIQRIAGAAKVDMDNAEATRLIVELERIAKQADAQVWAVHHTSKASRAKGATAVSRGASGLTDGARLSVFMEHHGDGRVKFSRGKTNISRPFQPLVLERRGRILTYIADAVVDQEEQEREDAKLEALCQHAVEVVQANGGSVKGRTDLKLLMKRGTIPQRKTAIIRVIADGRLVEGGTARKPELRVAAPKALPVAPAPKVVAIPAPPKPVEPKPVEGDPDVGYCRKDEADIPALPPILPIRRQSTSAQFLLADDKGLVIYEVRGKRDRFSNCIPGTALRIAMHGQGADACFTLKTAARGNIPGLAFDEAHLAIAAAKQLWAKLPDEARGICCEMSSRRLAELKPYLARLDVALCEA